MEETKKHETSEEHDEKKCCKGGHDEHGNHKCNEKVKDLQEKLELAMKLADDYKTKSNQYLNTATYYKNQAEETKKDFDRFKERNKNIEVEANLKANEIAVKKLLPVIDDFDQAINALSPDVMRGFVMIYSSLTSILKDFGAVEISANGEKLDPEKHNCIDTVKTDDEKLDDTIAKVYKKGYMFAETNTVIRPATVSVYKFDL